MLLGETVVAQGLVTDRLQSFPVLDVQSWKEIPRLEHGFLTRAGGVSAGPWAELNLSFKVGDAVRCVRENWTRVRSHVGGRIDFVTMNQVHGATVIEAHAGAARLGDADAMLSTARGAGLCVLTADCVPLLLLSPATACVAAVHAGWRGTLAGVVVEAVKEMTERTGAVPGEIRAALGPAIGACCYEVDADIVADIEARWGKMPDAIERYRKQGESKARLDLRAVNRTLLSNAGLDPKSILLVGGCTACSGEFFSHRVATSKGQGVTGRQLSFIGWAR